MRRGCVGTGGAAAAGAVASPSAAGGASGAPSATAPSPGAPSVPVLGSASLCTMVPPALNSIMFSAQSRHATRWRQGRRTTSRGEERQSRHSDEGSSSVADAGGTAGG